MSAEVENKKKRSYRNNKINRAKVTKMMEEDAKRTGHPFNASVVVPYIRIFGVEEE